MADLIAGTYEIIGHIGEGGGGNVFLAKHLRLQKNVVLKADKRRISAKPELLRREVDVLKNLSHSYIPKVFDFFVENETVYTVMDYIEGESLDKPLKRGERFSQPLVIKWARQLLQALSYLHSETHGDPPRGYVHSDIKPANLMRTSFGDICLIDFNIALALGEENVIGCSAGYASPEHYGLDYTTGLTQTSTSRTAEYTGSEKTELVSDGKPTSSGKRTVVPDVRSDIFSAGATLYHLFSGRRPDKDALKVTPLTSKDCSPQIAKIIAKAMNPNPDLRYQTADEMLLDLDRLHQNDPRVKRAKRCLAVSEASMAALLAAGVFLAFVGVKRGQVTEERLKFAEYSDNALTAGDRELAVDYALKALPDKPGLFSPMPLPAAQRSLAQALGVYDLSDSYCAYKTAELSSAPTEMALSADGKYCACVCSGSVSVIDTGSAEIICSLPADSSALSEAEFIGNETLLYAGADGLCAFDIAGNTVLWKGAPATGICVSGDGKTAAAVYKDESFASVYEIDGGKLVGTVDFGDRGQSAVFNDLFANPRDSLFALNRDGTKLAASFSDGSMAIFNPDNPDVNCDIFDDSSGFTHFEGGFYGDYLAFSAANETGSAFAVVDSSTNTQTGGFQSEDHFSVKTDENGIYIRQDNLVVKIDPETGDQVSLAVSSEPISGFVCGEDFALAAVDGGFAFFDRTGAPISEYKSEYNAGFLLMAGHTATVGFSDSPAVRILKYRNNAENELLTYDPAYLHDEARISADRKTVMLFTYDHFDILGMDGAVIASVDLPDPDQVYDQQFRRENGESRLEVIYYSGRTLGYSAADGSLILDEQRDKPDPSLQEEFLTEKLVISSPLHGTPQAHDRTTGALVAELDSDAYLTYITECGDNLIAQYVTADGFYYGVLMNEKCEELARMPYLCDVLGETLVFDYPAGNIRETHVHSLSELTQLAEGER